jgi:DNA-binding NarL/FixJ family response regulator
LAIDVASNVRLEASTRRITENVREGEMTDLMWDNREPTVLAERGVTPREADVFAGVARHLTNGEIASALRLSERTVESHVSSLLRKLQVANRRELADLATQIEASRRAHTECVRGRRPRLTAWRLLHP